MASSGGGCERPAGFLLACGVVVGLRYAVGGARKPERSTIVMGCRAEQLRFSLHQSSNTDRLVAVCAEGREAEGQLLITELGRMSFPQAPANLDAARRRWRAWRARRRWRRQGGRRPLSVNNSPSA